MNEQHPKHTLPRMRTLAKAIEEIKAEDPNTALTQNQLRVLVKSGAIPSVSAGRHTLINLDLLIAYLQATLTRTAKRHSLRPNMASCAALRNEKDLSSSFGRH